MHPPSYEKVAQDVETLEPKRNLLSEKSISEDLLKATVSDTDDPTLPTLTLRFWLISISFTLIVGFLNQIFWFRATPVSVGLLPVQLLTYPCGKALARWLPVRNLRMGAFSISLNPGPFNPKEHALIMIFISAACVSAYAIDIVTIKRVFYKSNTSFLSAWILVLTTQCIGYGLAGLARRILVKPASMVWPGCLVNISMFNALHAIEAKEDSAPNMSRFKIFGFIAVVTFFYQFLPQYLFTMLACISTLCFFGPNDKILNEFGSGLRGMGIFSISLSWSNIVAYLGSPIVTPLWAQINLFMGFAFFVWIIIPLGYYTNTWSALSFPFYSAKLFQTNGKIYDPLELLDHQTFALNEATYRSYGPLRLTFLFALTYGVGFAMLTSVVTHTIIYHGKDIWRRLGHVEQDLHARLMDRYEEVPDYWYLLVFLAMFSLAFLSCAEMNLPWWGLILAVGLSAFFLIPNGIVSAITSQSIGLNIVTEFLIGYLLPGQPLANVTFKTYGHISLTHALSFLRDLKMGHYMKIPPRHLFVAQISGALLASTISTSTAYLVYFFVPSVCQDLDSAEWGCGQGAVFYSASVVWGVIGPAKMFGAGSLYGPLLHFFWLGALAPIPFWLLSRRYPHLSWLKYVHMPLFFASVNTLPPATSVMYVSWLLCGILVYRIIAARRRSFLVNYGYSISAGLDTGVAFCTLSIYALSIFYGRIEWWGNEDSCKAV